MSLKWLPMFLVCAAVFGALHALPIESESSVQNLETLESEMRIQPGSEGGEVIRQKRTIGILRQLFPTLSEIIDRKIQAITRLVFRLVGRLVLRGAAGGNNGGGGTDDDSSGSDGRRISITLPTFPPSTADEDEDEDSTDVDATVGTDDVSTTTTEPSLTDNSVSESKASPVLVRKARQAQSAEEKDDQDTAAAGDNELSSSVEDKDDNDAAESGETDDNRGKRLVNLGGGSGGSGGGSGNFLFDIIRLVAGSGTSQTEDEANNAPLDDGNATSAGRDDGYSAGVPGPLTRLFVIANRGIANLIQDLILRLAQTSERIVNFKARLITSII